MKDKKPVAWLADDGFLLRVFTSISDASKRTNLSKTTIRRQMKKGGPNFRSPTLKDLKLNYNFEVSNGYPVTVDLFDLINDMEVEHTKKGEDAVCKT